MSLSDLVSGGAGCGPSNPLQSIGKRFGQDRGAQQDSFANSPTLNSKAPRFDRIPNNVHDAFDVSQLRGNLPSGSRTPMQQNHHHRPVPIQHGRSRSELPSGFLEECFCPATGSPYGSVGLGHRLSERRSLTLSSFSTASAADAHREHVLTHPPQRHPDGYEDGRYDALATCTSPPAHAGARPTATSHPHHADYTPTPVDNAKWAEAFTAFERPPASGVASQPSSTQNLSRKQTMPTPGTRRTRANRRQTRSSVEHDQSAKFKQSNFLDLMRRSSQPQSQQEAYNWANQMASSGGLSHLRPVSKSRSLPTTVCNRTSPSTSALDRNLKTNKRSTIMGREDARSAAIERQP
ncbi:uncharacterized protein UTRI_02460 [Ustilago trichophora]|uniref:Uncharacterized protein n=1 Tax=Ustilago trichophora TaxID=86804 RepID=A0A5C3E640_9BASI|nr:uncharacterized protein UTRI_02460 [Ustilago trichophora]